MRLSKRLKLLVVLCIMLTVILALALYGQRKDMQQSYSKINQLIEVQLTIDLVRANLWLLQQFQDQKAVSETRSAVERLQRMIDITAGMPLNEYEKRLLHNIRRHQHNITLLLQLSENKSDSQGEVSAEATSNAALTARYNTIVQSLSEDSLRFQQITIRNSLDSESKHLFFNATLILAIALIVTLFSLQTLNSFKRKFGMLKHGIQELARGDLSSKLSMPPGDEFAELSDAFNQMKHELMQTMQRRDELQQEVEAQTKQLMQQQEKLRQMAEYDDLTGIYNRGAAQNYISISLERCKRQQTQAAVLFIDLDDFKPINDQFGHKIGDFVLKELANRMTHTLRASDIIARLGGDEFIIWLDPLKDDEQIATVTEKLGKLGHDIYIEELQQMLDVRISVGSSIYPEHGSNITELISHADQQMYQQKKINKQQNQFKQPKEASAETKKLSPLVYVDFRTDK
ncbi:diguanylate cyclase [Shewanella sp. C32]|uniref:Diguanylate cyclase n=1 Tax=Shewanella electrica TaxID=515560 RepID=A0ABT2FQ03_9GAMM|nr:diguanylate cyclase [Shewanella electrica]MCH1926836.1 diguanylate cyclase [Shewanella electrica]MCS4558397.1 diguanylate cyclase [Shewanella electrica]